MSYNTGLFFAHETGLLNSGSQVFGATGSYQSTSTLQTYTNNNLTATIDCGGASTCMIIPMLLADTSSDGSGSNSPDIHIYGVIGFGEPTQNQFNERGKLLYQLGRVTAASVSSNTQGAQSTQLVERTASGVKFATFAGAGAGTDQVGDIFIGGEAVIGGISNAIDVEEGTITDGNVGCVLVTGINIFQQLILTFNIRSGNTDTKANALCCLKY